MEARAICAAGHPLPSTLSCTPWHCLGVLAHLAFALFWADVTIPLHRPYLGRGRTGKLWTTSSCCGITCRMARRRRSHGARIFHRSLRRPREEKGIDLSKVTQPTAPAPAQPGQEDLDRLRELEAELEASVGNTTPQVTPPASPACEAVKQLVRQQLEPVASQTGAETEYRSKKGDYYPTARGPAAKK